MGAEKNAAPKPKKIDRVIALVKRLVKAKELEATGKPSRAELDALANWLGRPVPPVYSAIMTEVGAIGHRASGWHGWSRDHKNIYSPKDAIAVTEKMRSEWGKDGRHAALVNETFFCSHWQLTLEVHGVDAAGQVRKLRLHRPGTMMRVDAPSLEDHLLAKLGELAASESLEDAAKAPDEVTDLVLGEGESLASVMKLEGLERLTLRGIEDGAHLALLGKHPTLQTLSIEWGGVDELPDALFHAPELTKIELWRTPAKQRYGAGLDGVLAWFREAEIPPKKRPLYIRLLSDDVAWISKHATAEDLLGALDAPNDRIAEAAHRALATHLEAPKNLKGAFVAVLGKPQTKQEALASQLEGAGATAEKKIGPKTTHVLVGVRPKETWRDAKKKKLPLLHETHLRKVLDRHGARFLATKEAKGEAPEKLRELLLGPDAANVDLAIRMMEQGGVPDGVLEAMLLVIQNPDMPAKTRKALEVLAATNLPELPRIVRDVLARTNLFQCGATKLADRLVLLEKKSHGKISGRRLALDLLAKESRDDDDGEKSAGRAVLYAFETGDQAFAKEALALARGPRSLCLDGLEARIGPALDKAGAAIAAEKGIETLSLQWTYLREVPSTIAKLTSLKKLVLADNDLKTLPEALASLAKLEELDISDNRMSELPPVITKLRALKVLRVAQVEDKPRLRSLPEALGSLPKLERIELEGQKAAISSAVVATLRTRGVSIVTK